MTKTNKGRAMQPCGIVMALLTLGSCMDEPAHSAPLPLPDGRVVAVYYKVQNSAGITNCQRRPSALSPRMTRVGNGAIVTIADANTKLIREENTYWLEVYPPLSHRPTCFINTRDLIPLPNPR